MFYLHLAIVLSLDIFFNLSFCGSRYIHYLYYLMRKRVIFSSLYNVFKWLVTIYQNIHCHLLVNVKELKKCDLSYDSEERNLLNARLVSLRSTYQSFLPQTPACVGVVPISAVDANLFIKSNLLKHQ